jgi:translation initiation factor 2 subunit 1
MEGMILSTEVTRKRVKSVKKLIKVGKQEVMSVIRVDKEKRYIDLSKKQV